MSEATKIPQDAKTPTSGAAPALYSQSFFSKEMRASRQLLFPTLALPLLYTSLLMWACLSIYWGSLIPNDNVTKLTVMAVDLDGGFLGDQIFQGIHAHIKQTPNHLNWVFGDLVRSDARSKSLLLDEQVWAVLQGLDFCRAFYCECVFSDEQKIVSANASSSLDSALRSGDATYIPVNAVTIYVTTGRNQITSNSHVIPSILAVISPLLSKAGANHTAQFLTTVAADTEGLRTALRCPQCLASPFASKQVDLRPFDSTAASGSTMVGLIFVRPLLSFLLDILKPSFQAKSLKRRLFPSPKTLIQNLQYLKLLTFTFSIFQILHTTGVVIGERLNLKSAILLRTINSLFAYFIISLWYTLINLAFGVPMNRFFGNSGFLIYWMLNMCTMAAGECPNNTSHSSTPHN